MAAQDLEEKVPSFKGFTLEKEDQLRDSANWENFRYKFNLEMSQKENVTHSSKRDRTMQRSANCSISCGGR